jgi:hypothetical protein
MQSGSRKDASAHELTVLKKKKKKAKVTESKQQKKKNRTCSTERKQNGGLEAVCWFVTIVGAGF